MKPAVTSPLFLAAVLLTTALGGCGSPQKANIELRRQNADLQVEVTRLRALVGNDEASPIATTGTPTRPQLYVPSAIRLGRLTGISDGTLHVYACPVDAAGDALKWPGDFTITAFNLSQPTAGPIGSWRFTGPAAANAWRSGGLIFEYVLDCPLATNPATGAQITVRVDFQEPYLQQTLTAQTVVKP